MTRGRFSLTALLVIVLFILPAVAAPRPELPGGITDKPYLGRGGADVMIGGYMDHEFLWTDSANTFDAHRFVPFITARVSDRVTVSTEIEFEHGGNLGGDGEVKLEYAVMDFSLNEKVSFRGGVILSPLGAFNLRHDSPLNDLTARPTVDRQLIPSTLSESGMGFFGSLYPSDESALSYEVYLVNGFNEGVLSGEAGAKKLRIRSGRGSQKMDNNENKAITGRLGFSPRLGLDLGLSTHTGKYDDDGEKTLTITALDGAASFGALELTGEFAVASADVDQNAEPGLAEAQRGAYVQTSWHIMHDRLLDGSVVTLTARGDVMDFDSDIDGDKEEGLTLGVNLRPTEETVFKLDWNRSWTTARNSTEQGDGEDRISFSFATYF